jgi:predicted acetyltransferase
MSQALVLRRARLAEEAEVMRAHRATSPDVPSFLHHYTDGMPFARYLEVLEAQERDAGIIPGQVPSTFLFAFLGHRVVGRVAIRHRLTGALLRVGGHIGYVVVPEFRRRGHATEMLRLALGIARDRLRLDRVLVTCDENNVGSIRVIERNGGVLESVVDGPEPGRPPTRRYWSDTGTPRRPQPE